MFMPTIANQGTEEQKKIYLEPALKYEIIGCYAQTEASCLTTTLSLVLVSKSYLIIYSSLVMAQTFVDWKLLQHTSLRLRHLCLIPLP